MISLRDNFGRWLIQLSVETRCEEERMGAMADSVVAGDNRDDLLRMTAEIVSAYVGHNAVAAGQIPDVIRGVHGALENALGDGGAVNGDLKPAVPIKKSVTSDYIICLEDGKKLKMLKRYLRSSYGLSPEDYRAKWGLPPDYPMVAPNYAKQRSAFAKKIGLGKRGRGRK
jgi:predicted transcriptional regulator